MPPPIDPTTSPTDAATLAKIQQLLKDPIAGPKLMAIVNQPNTGMASGLGNIASAVSKQTSPSGQLGAGLGGAIGMGLQQLLKKKPGPTMSTDQILSLPATSRIGGGDYSPTLGDVDDFSNEMTPINAARGGKIDAKRPILSTTIVIAKKPKKPEKKRTGGGIKARRPNAIPPKHGPGNGDSEPAAPFAKGGRVQTPRGSGCAERGKQFRGIY